MSITQLIKDIREEIPEVTALLSQKSDIVREIEELEDSRLKKVFGKFTVSEIEKMWDKADHMQRFNILDAIPEFDSRFQKLDDHGGLRAGELIQEVIEAKWNKTEWISDMESYFESYCKVDAS